MHGPKNDKHWSTYCRRQSCELGELLVKKYGGYPEGGMSFEQTLVAGAAKRTTTASPSTESGLQDALTRAQQAITSAANEVSQTLGLNNLPEPETVASQLHNQSLGFARTLGQFVGQLQNEVSLCDDALTSSLNIQDEHKNTTWFQVVIKSELTGIFLQNWWLQLHILIQFHVVSHTHSMCHPLVTRQTSMR